MVCRTLITASLLCVALGEFALKEKNAHKEVEAQSNENTAVDHAVDDELSEEDMKMLLDKLDDEEFTDKLTDRLVDKLFEKGSDLLTPKDENGQPLDLMAVMDQYNTAIDTAMKEQYGDDWADQLAQQFEDTLAQILPEGAMSDEDYDELLKEQMADEDEEDEDEHEEDEDDNEELDEQADG